MGETRRSPARRAGEGGNAIPRGGEGLAAAAGGGGIRVAHLEARLLQRVHEVEGGAGEIQRALLVDDHAHAVHAELGVVVAHGVVEGQLVAQARAAASHDLEAQPVGLLLAFLLEQLPDALRGGLGDLDQGHTILLGPN
jgi:hypothetical protein